MSVPNARPRSACLPIGPKDRRSRPRAWLSCSQHGAVYGGTTLLSSLLLAKSYLKVASNNLTQFLKKRSRHPPHAGAGTRVAEPGSRACLP